MNTIEELYYGKINPQEKFFDQNSSYPILLHTIAENKEKLQKLLEGNTRLYFMNMVTAMEDLSDLESKERFIEGFQLGARLILDILIPPAVSDANQ